MCAGCAIAAIGGASGARVWLQAHAGHLMTPARLKFVTIALFAAAMLVSTLRLSGSAPTAPPTAHAHAPAAVVSP